MTISIFVICLGAKIVTTLIKRNISFVNHFPLDYEEICSLFLNSYYYPGSQAPFWGEEVTSPAIVGLNTFLVRLCHPIEGLGELLTKFFWRDG